MANSIEQQLDWHIERNWEVDDPQITVSDGVRTYRLNPAPERLKRFKSDYAKACKVSTSRPRHPSVIVKLSEENRAKLLGKLIAEGVCDGK